MEKLTICFDFDGVCAFYNGWEGFDNFGTPILKTASLTQKLVEAGHTCILWTTRLFTPKLSDWLVENGFCFDSINSTSHNPPHTSSKPMADIYVDNRAICFSQDFAKSSCNVVLSRIEQLE